MEVISRVSTHVGQKLIVRYVHGLLSETLQYCFISISPEYPFVYELCMGNLNNSIVSVPLVSSVSVAVSVRSCGDSGVCSAPA